MEYKVLDMAAYGRKKQFDYFRSLAYPYLGLTVNVDITDFLRGVKDNGLPFFLCTCYCLAQAANHVPEFCQRIHGDEIWEYTWCQSSHTEALDDGSYCYCTLDSCLSFQDFLPKAIEAQANARAACSLSDGDDGDSLLFFSCVPFLSYSGLVQPVPYPADSNPRITWGRYFTQGDRILMPVSALCHHALMDAVHISRFFEEFERRLSGFFSD